MAKGILIASNHPGTTKTVKSIVETDMKLDAYSTNCTLKSIRSKLEDPKDGPNIGAVVLNGDFHKYGEEEAILAELKSAGLPHYVIEGKDTYEGILALEEQIKQTD